MPQKCRVCAHPKTRDMEKAFIRGKPKTRIAKQYGVNVRSVDYHMEHHLSEKLVRSFQEKEQEHAEDILSGIRDLLNRTKTILDKAEEKDQKRLALDAIREARSTYELLSKIAVKLEEYRLKDQEKQSGLVEQQLTDGLGVLSDEELLALTQLMAKVHAADPDYELDSKARLFMDGVYRIFPPDDDDVNGYTGTSNGPEPSEGKTPRTRSRKAENRRERNENELDLELDDLDFDLELDEDNEIPSEKTDPHWLRRERRRRRRRNR